MLLPRDHSPFLRDGRESAPFSRRTIDDPLVRLELSELLYEAPAAFLGLAAETTVHHGPELPTLVLDLIESGVGEGTALAAAIGWLGSDQLALNEPDWDASFERVEALGLPSWLSHLDQIEIVEAVRRREVGAESVSSYLVEYCFIGGQVATLHVRVDHELGGALTNAFITDDQLVTVRQIFKSTDRWRRQKSRDPTSSNYGLGPAKPFRPIKAATATRAISGAILAADQIDVPIDLNSQWPGIRPLVLFLLAEPAKPAEGGLG